MTTVAFELRAHSAGWRPELRIGGEIAAVREGSTWPIVAAVVGPSGPPGTGGQQVYVQSATPTFDSVGIWVQTGLAPGGTGFTLWFEDGL